MPINTTAAESEIQRGAVFGYDPVNQRFQVVQVDANGVVATSGGGGGGGGDVRLKDATLAQFAAVDASGRVSVADGGTTLSVDDGAGSLTVDGTVAVSNFPATQPVSGTVSVTEPVTVDGSVGVTTDPVHVDGKGVAGTPSGGVLSVQGVASGTPLPVSGTFFQATQPVSLAAAVDVSDRAARLLGVLSAGTNNIGDVDVLTLPALAAGTNNIGDVDVLTLPALPAGTNRIGAVRPVDSADADLTSVKSTQTARFLGVQKVRDAGRVSKAFKATVTTTTASTTLISFARSDDGGTDAGGSTDYTVTAGKRFVVTSITIIERSTTGNTTATMASLHFRTNTAGAVATGSPVQLGPINFGHPATAIAVGGREHLTFGDGWEIAAGTHFGMTYSSAAWVTTTCVPIWDITILGYEY